MRLLDLFVFKYNRTDFHELNLDWIISDMRTLAETLQNFINLNTIKYANPIQWNITTQYEANTVVIDANDGTAYLSVQPVPTGVAITNTDYWIPIFTLNLLSANQNITLRDDGSNVLATFASTTDDWLIWNSVLYKVSQPIAINEAYVVGYNLDRYSVELFIKDYIDALKTIIGDLDDLTTADKTSIVNALNSIITLIGDLDDLTTTDKTSVVNALNSIITLIGDLDDLTTTDKTSIVNALNSVFSALPFNRLDDISAATTITENEYSLDNKSISSSANIKNDAVVDGYEITSSFNPAIEMGTDSQLKNGIINASNIGVNLNYNGSHASIINNNITAADYGALVNSANDGQDIKILNNSIHATAGDAIEVNTPNNENTHDTHGVIASNNFLKTTGSYGGARGFAVGIARGRSVIISNNIVDGSELEAVHVEDNTKKVIITNNIFDKCKANGTLISVNYSKNNFTKNGLTNGGRPILVTNNVFSGASGNTSIGLTLVNTSTDDDSICNMTNNIIDGFRIGIGSSSNSNNVHARNFDGCVVTDCQIGMGLNDTYNIGEITFSDITGVILNAAGLCHVDAIHVLDYKAPDDIIALHATLPTQLTINKITANISQAMIDGGSYSVFKIPNGLNGVFTLEFYVGGNRESLVFNCDGSTITMLSSKYYGSVSFNVSIADGYLKVSTYNLSSTTDVIAKLTFEGIACYKN